MSSIRNQFLGRIWHGNDAENTNPTETKKLPRNQSLTLINDSNYASGSSLRSRSTTLSLSQPATIRSSENGSDNDQHVVEMRASTSASNYSTPRRSLHKAASTTFKFFSDTIRSKTQLFYVESPRPGTPYPAESGKPVKQDHKSRILSSLRSRHSRKDKVDDVLEDQPVHAIVRDIPHELHIDIPDSTLLEIDSPLPREAQYARIVSSCSAESQNAPPPADSPTQLKPLHIPSGSSRMKDGSVYTTELRQSIHDLGSPEISPVPDIISSSGLDSIVEDSLFAHARSSDGGEPCDILALIDSQTLSSPQGAKSSKGFRTGGNLFVKGNREQTRKVNIPSPYRRALRNSESLEEVSENPVNPPRHVEPLDVLGEVKAPSRPSIKRATSLPRGLSDIMMSDHEGGSSAEGPPKLASEGYDGDAESGSELLEEASMGPKSQWDKARADRLRRYQAVRTLSSETVVDTSDEEGLQLRPFKSGQASTVGSPSSAARAIRKVHFVTSEEIGTFLRPAETDSMRGNMPLIHSKEAETKPLSVQATVEPIVCGDVEDEWHLAKETPETEIKLRSYDSNSQACSLSLAGVRFALEAIERPSGISMNSPETNPQISPFVRAGIQNGTEAIDKPSGDSMNSWEDAVESDSDCTTSVVLERENPRKSSREDHEQSARSSTRPMSVRQMSSCSIATADSCAVTTSSQLCYKEIPSPCLHLHTTPVRRTSSINDEIHQVRDETGIQEPFLITPPIEATTFGAVWSMRLHPPTPMKEETTTDVSEALELEIAQTPDLTSDQLFSNNYRPSDSRSSSMCAPSSDFVRPSKVPALFELSPRTTPRESDLRPYQCQSQSVMPGTWDPEQVTPTVDTASDSGNEMGEWLAEHPDSESLLEAGFGQGTTDNELDFLAANPELGQYLDRAFPREAYSAADFAFSDDKDEGFRTPISTPLKRGQRASRNAGCSQSQPLSTDSDLRNPVPSPSYQEGGDEFVAARLPRFKSESPENFISSKPGNMDAAFTSEEVLLLRDITPTGPGAARGHGRTRSWQMRDSSYGGGEFTYDAVGSPKKELQTSSVKKGVWWGRGQEAEHKEEEESPLAGKQVDFNSWKECDREEEALLRIEQHLQRNQREIEDVKKMLAESVWKEDRSTSGSTDETLTEGNGQRKRTTSEGGNEKGKENTPPAKFLSPRVEGKPEPYHPHGLGAQDLDTFFNFLAPLVRLQAQGQKGDASGLEPHQGKAVVRKGDEVAKKWNWDDEVGFEMGKWRGFVFRGGQGT